MSEWPKRMYVWQDNDGAWHVSAGASLFGIAIPVTVYPADAAPQPVAMLHVEQIDSDGIGHRFAAMPPNLPVGSYPLYTAPPDAEAIRQEERERIAGEIVDAIVADCENGVKWLNEKAAADFKRAYPRLSAAIGAIRRGEMT